jgi:hypothetical protein
MAGFPSRRRQVRALSYCAARGRFGPTFSVANFGAAQSDGPAANTRAAAALRSRAILAKFGQSVGTTQLSRLPDRTLSRGGTRLGSSRLQVVTSISSGKSEFSKVTWLPQRGQNDRVPLSRLEPRRFAAGVTELAAPPDEPCHERRASRATTNRAMAVALVKRHAVYLVADGAAITPTGQHWPLPRSNRQAPELSVSIGGKVDQNLPRGRRQGCTRIHIRSQVDGFCRGPSPPPPTALGPSAVGRAAFALLGIGGRTYCPSAIYQSEIRPRQSRS